MPVKIKALKQITEWDGEGLRMVVLNPGTKGEDTDTVGDNLAKALVDAGAAKIVGDKAAEPAPAVEPAPAATKPAPAPPPARNTENDKVVAEKNGFTLTDIGGGYYTIAGPGLAEPEKLRGKKAAEPRFNELSADPAPATQPAATDPAIDASQDPAGATDEQAGDDAGEQSSGDGIDMTVPADDDAAPTSE